MKIFFKYRQRGFTLVEVLIALLFLLIAIVPISIVLESFYRGSYDSRSTGIGLFLAEAVIEDLVKTGYSLSEVTTTLGALSGFPEYTRYYEISKDSDFNPSNAVPHSGTGSGTTSFKRLKAVVYWGDSREERVELVNILGTY